MICIPALTSHLLCISFILDQLALASVSDAESAERSITRLSSTTTHLIQVHGMPGVLRLIVLIHLNLGSFRLSCSSMIPKSNFTYSCTTSLTTYKSFIKPMFVLEQYDDSNLQLIGT